MRFERRGVVLSPFDLRGMIETWLDWIAGAGLNVLGIHASVADVLGFVESDAGAACLRRAEALGLDVEYELHALGWLLPRARFAEHPDWFRLDSEGHRTPDANLCTSNAAALDMLGERAVALARRLPQTTNRYYLWADDDRPWCACPPCRDFSPSDQNVRAMNAVAAALRRWRPDAHLACLAYLDTIEPPTRVKPDPALFLEYAPIKRDSSRPLDDTESAENAKHAANLRRLTSAFDMTGSQVLEYWLDASRFSGWKRPSVRIPFDEAVVERDAQFYASLGFRGATTFAVFVDAEYVERFGVPPIRRYGEALRGDSRSE